MAREQNLSIFQLEDRLAENELENVGSCIGQVYQDSWKFLIYLGEHNFLTAYEKSQGVIQDSIEYLQKNLDASKYKANGYNNANVTTLVNYKSFKSDAVFYKYDLNIFTTALSNRMKTSDLINIIEFNLNQIEQLEVGDIIMFERGLYHHSALLIDYEHMLCIHRSGEPDNPGDLAIASSSLLGIPTAKASVTEDHLIEIAGYSRLKKSNEIFDKKLSPKSKEEIVSEAKKRLGESGYSVTSKNCQHFVSECRNGNAISPEVEQIAAGAFYSGIIGMATLVLAVASKYFQTTKKRIESKPS